MKIISKVLSSFIFTLLTINTSIAKEIPDFEVPNFMQISEVAGGINLGQLDVKTYVFKSTKGNKEILAFYNKLWKGEVKSLSTPEWIYNSYFDGEFLYTIQVQRKKENTFSTSPSHNGIIGISQPTAAKNVTKRPKLENTYPMTPGTKVLTDLSSIDLGKKSRTTVFDSPGSVMRNLLHYKRHFEQNNWSEVLDKMSIGMARELGGSSLIMQQGVNELVISFVSGGNNRTKIVAVLVEK